jgi:hypothetical protein
MPVVTQVEIPPNGQTTVERPAGSILARAVPVQQLRRAYINIVLYGENRVGKSTLGCQAEKPLLYISFEPGEQGGAESIRKIPSVEFVQIGSRMDAVQLAKELRGDQYYKTHLLDTCTSLQNNVIMRELMGLDSAPVQLNFGEVSQDVYRKRSEIAKEVMQCFRDLPVNTIFIAQQRDHNKSDESRKLQSGLNLGAYFAADLGPGTVKWMHDACDFICHLYLAPETRAQVIKGMEVGGIKGPDMVQYIETGRTVRRLRTVPDQNHAAGIRSSTPEAVPDYIEAPYGANGPKAMFDDLTRVIRGEKALKGYYPKPE